MRAPIVALLLLLAAPAAAAPNAEPWPRWEAHDPAATAEIDHRAWHDFLQAHVVAGTDGINRIPYGRIPRKDKEALDAYVARLAATPISRFARPEQAAYWINLYNALTVKVVLDHYPVASIRDIRISPGLFSVGPWGKKLVAVEGESLSLDDIEHRVLRPVWRDARLHYAVNCASLGCPNLAREAYTRANLEALLEAGARAYVNHPRGARHDAGRLTASSIYVWFQEDFGGSDAGVIAHLRRYAAPPLAAVLADATRISGHGYDWALNDAR
jgi:hypothetical protein